MTKATDYATSVIIGATELLSGKASDYGGPEKSFSDIASITSILRGKTITSLDVAAVLIALKLSRLGNLTREGAPIPEYDSLLDVTQDAINYIGLFESIRVYGEEGEVNLESKIEKEEASTRLPERRY